MLKNTSKESRNRSKTITEGRKKHLNKMVTIEKNPCLEPRVIGQVRSNLKARINKRKNPNQQQKNEETPKPNHMRQTSNSIKRKTKKRSQPSDLQVEMNKIILPRPCRLASLDWIWSSTKTLDLSRERERER